MSIEVTEKAITEVKRVMEEQKFVVEEHALEVGVAGGGCSGFQYKLGFKPMEEVDPLNETIYTFHGVKVTLDNRVLPFIEGTTIDFHSGLDKRGFVFANPNAKKGCGCGNSFSVG